MNIVVTGAHGFIGKNLVAWLERQTSHQLLCFGRQDPWARLAEGLAQADFVFHLAGVNRPQTTEEYYIGNVAFTDQICNQLRATGRTVPLVLASSIQAAMDNPYGQSKRQAEEVVQAYAQQVGTHVAIYRLPNVFGKWCRPNYNSVVATFCHNLARNQPITISDRNRTLELVYVDDVIQQFVDELAKREAGAVDYPQVHPTYSTTLGRLADLLQSFRQMRQTLVAAEFSEPLVHKLYATYLSYLEEDSFAYGLERKCDQRGCLAEFIKSPAFGQIFVSRTLPGVTRGNHYHHTKTEKFLVLEGKAMIRFRHLNSDTLIEYPVCGEEFRVVDIPPGYTHSIENVGSSELITLFWASEVFNPTQPDTYALPVIQEGGV